MATGTPSRGWNGILKWWNRVAENSEERLILAEAVRTACLIAARDGYQSAAISGLCAEGAQEAALSAIQMVDLENILRVLLIR